MTLKNLSHKNKQEASLKWLTVMIPFYERQERDKSETRVRQE